MAFVKGEHGPDVAKRKKRRSYRVATEETKKSRGNRGRRVSKSKLLKAPVRVRTEDGKEEVFNEYVLEVDKDRIYLKSENPYPAGTVLHLGIDLPGYDRTIHFKGEVVRINPHKPATPDGLDPGMGIIFDRVSYDHRKLISEYLEKVQSEDRSEDYSMFLAWVSRVSRPMSTVERDKIKKDLLKVLYTTKDLEPIPMAKRRKSAKEMDIISAVPLFEDLSDLELEEMARIMAREELRAGDAVFDEGDVGDKMYIIASGSIDIIKSAGKGKPGQILVTLKAGDYFGEMSLIDEAPRSAAAMAGADSVLFSIKKKDLILLLDNAPTIAAKIYKFFVTTLNQRLRETNEKIKTFVNMAQEMSQS